MFTLYISPASKVNESEESGVERGIPNYVQNDGIQSKSVVEEPSNMVGGKSMFLLCFNVLIKE